MKEDTLDTRGVAEKIQSCQKRPTSADKETRIFIHVNVHIVRPSCERTPATNSWCRLKVTSVSKETLVSKETYICEKRDLNMYIYTYIYTYVHINICIYVYVYICMCIYI